MKFDFSHFPEESEIIEDVNRILVESYGHGTILEIADKIMAHHEKNKLDPEEAEMDVIGIECFDLIGREVTRLPDLPDPMREALAVLWVNHMCGKKPGDIINVIGNLIQKGVNYKKIAMESVAYGKNGDTSEAMYDGSIMYLWTMGSVVRSLHHAMKMEGLEVPQPNVYMGVSLN
jgi:hypothetical protein